MKILVADSSAIVAYILRTESAPAVESLLAAGAHDVHIPALCDVEVLASIRRAAREGHMDQQHALLALQLYRDLPLTRHGHSDLLPRAFGLRSNFTAYDAMYVALAELLDGTLLTGDRSLPRATVSHTRVPVEEI